MEIIAAKEVKEYYTALEKEIEKALEKADAARKKGYDCTSHVETTAVSDLAERAETIVGPKGVAKRYREIMAKTQGENKRLTAIFQIFREIINQELCEIPDKSKRVEQAIKTALVLYTDGVVVAPVDGITKIIISKNPDGTNYIDIYYAGPIRAAGGTSQVLPLILGDYARKLLSLDKYKPTKDEIERYVEETQIYDELVSRQYKLSDDEVRKIAAGCPVCINGEPTEKQEVSVHRDLARIPHNRIRGGACLVISEGIALKARKALKFAEMLELDWSWLESIIKHDKTEGISELEPNDKYLSGAAAGRPIICYPSRIGGLRMRYGRTRASGIMGRAMHPATMEVLEGFIAIGTQLKVERPGKSAIVTACNTIEGPIVKLKDGTVLRIEKREEAAKIKPMIEKILFLGDLLIPLGDYKYTAHSLVPAGYNEEWWLLELKKAIKETNSDNSKAKEAIEKKGNINFETAISLSKELGIAMHPKYTYYYKAINVNEMQILLQAMKKSQQEQGSLMLEKNHEIKEILEKIGLPHSIENGKIVAQGDEAKTLKTFFCMELPENAGDDINKIISKITGITVKDKGGTFIGARMGRPEASGERKMKGKPHLLFPIGNYGGNIRNITKAMAISERNSGIEVEIAMRQCTGCMQIMPANYCPKCKRITMQIRICPECKAITDSEKCKKCGNETKTSAKRKERIDLTVKDAANRLGLRQPDLLKGVRGLMSADKIPEPVEKGILRAKHSIHTYKDGTIRYELINVPLTHFKPEEIGTSIEKLKELGYTKDINGKEIKSKKQVVEIYPQDLIIHNNAGDFLVKVSKFVDEELEKFYHEKPVYNADSKEDLTGKLVLGIAPHTSAAIVGRIIGFTKGRGCFAHPYFHQTKRRNADGDQDSVMLLMDVLLNFSKEYLQSSRGGRMDAPLVFTTVLKPDEIDTEVYCMDICKEYPLELYEKSLELAPIDAVKVQFLENKLGKEHQYTELHYTHETEDFCNGPEYSTYVQLKSMEDKINAQAKLQSKIKAVDLKDSLTRVIETHLLPDIIGNTRAFSRQQFRCTDCNAKYRRVPLNGKCKKCGKQGLILTIAQGSVEKYLQIAKNIVTEYNLSDYLKQRLELIEEEISSVFGGQALLQKSLAEYS